MRNLGNVRFPLEKKNPRRRTLHRANRRWHVTYSLSVPQEAVTSSRRNERGTALVGSRSLREIALQPHQTYHSSFYRALFTTHKRDPYKWGRECLVRRHAGGTVGLLMMMLTAHIIEYGTEVHLEDRLWKQSTDG